MMGGHWPKEEYEGYEPEPDNHVPGAQHEGEAEACREAEEAIKARLFDLWEMAEFKSLVRAIDAYAARKVAEVSDYYLKDHRNLVEVMYAERKAKIAEAVAAERERCAWIAERFVSNAYAAVLKPGLDSIMRLERKALAAEIRSSS